MDDGVHLIYVRSGWLGVHPHRRAKLLPGSGDISAVCYEAEGEEAAGEKVGLCCFLYFQHMLSWSNRLN